MTLNDQDKESINNYINNMTDFLPKDYKEPETSSYMKFVEGKNRFRVLGSAIVGMEYWKTVDGSRKPIRKKMDEPIQVGDLELNEKTGEPERPKHFWAFPVFNRETETVQILEITQKGIRTAIKSMVTDDDWGDPKDYDITVTRTGEGFDTEYSVMPNPKKELDEGITQLYKDMDIKLEALFDGADPFEQSVEEMFTT